MRNARNSRRADPRTGVVPGVVLLFALAAGPVAMASDFDVAVFGLNVHETVDRSPTGLAEEGVRGAEYYLSCGVQPHGSGPIHRFHHAIEDLIDDEDFLLADAQQVIVVAAAGDDAASRVAVHAGPRSDAVRPCRAG